MSASVHLDAGRQPQGEADLTDDQIQQLLQEAEGRLRGDDVHLIKSTNADSLRIPKLASGPALAPYVRQDNGIATAETTQLIDPKQKELSNLLHPVQVKKSSNEKTTAGPDWFDLPKTEMTPQLKRDLQLLRMRSVLDPKRHYKKENGKAKPPEFSQVGTIIEGPAEFFSGRIAKKDRKKTFVEEAMAMERETKRFQTKYQAIQVNKQSGKKAFYNKLRAKRNRKDR